MRLNKIKIILIIVIILAAIFAAWAAVGALTPPTIPVLYYGTASINGVATTSSPVITMRRKTDSLEIASSTTSQTGKYFMEVPCSDYVGINFVFRIGDLIASEYQCVDVASVASVKLNLNFNSANQTIENTTSSVEIPSSISDSTEVKINFIATSTVASSTTATIGSSGLILTRESAEPDNNFIVTFPANTVITGSGAWDGTLIAPSLSVINLNLPADPGYQGAALKVITLGYGGQSLTFDQPVSILFPGQTGKRVGYSVNGADFTEITAICPENSPASLTATTTQECKFNGPVDLTVWTKHFTYFAVYHQVYVPPSSSGGGYTYDTLNQQIAATTSAAISTPLALTTTPTSTAESITAPLVKPPVTAQILGIKLYADGTLIRGKDRKIYLISQGKLIVIRTLAQLRPYRGQPIYDVSDLTIRHYFIFPDGSLLRGPNKKIYVLNQGRRQPVLTLTELRNKYFKKEIFDVASETLAKYPLK